MLPSAYLKFTSRLWKPPSTDGLRPREADDGDKKVFDSGQGRHCKFVLSSVISDNKQSLLNKMDKLHTVITHKTFLTEKFQSRPQPMILFLVSDLTETAVPVVNRNKVSCALMSTMI